MSFQSAFWLVALVNMAVLGFVVAMALFVILIDRWTR